MASDAYMEISDPNVWGEAIDELYGMGDRALGAFEIFNFEMSATTTREKESLATQPAHARPPQPVWQVVNGRGQWVHPGAPPQAPGLDNKKKVAVNTFTIRKYIDKASADLLLACCKSGLEDAKPMDWAVISFRESGEIQDDKSKRVPYLVLEFQKLWVDSLTWSVTPGGDASSASQEETVTFAFQTILVKYSPQEATGTHKRVKIKGFDTAEPKNQVEELSWDRSQGLERIQDY